METDESLRQNLTEIMSREGISAFSWSRKAGIPESTLRAFMGGRTKTIQFDTLLKLAKALNITVEYILGVGTDHTGGKEQKLDETLWADAKAVAMEYILQQKILATPEVLLELVRAAYDIGMQEKHKGEYTPLRLSMRLVTEAPLILKRASNE